MQTEARLVAYFAIALGSVAFCVGWFGNKEVPFMQASGAVVVAGLALLGAAAAVFRAGKVDPEAETVVWPNVADVAPEVWQRGFPEGQPADEPADSAT